MALTESEQRGNRERFLSVLNDITYAALEIQSSDELLQLLADRLAEIILADGCFLTFWDEETKTAIPCAAYGAMRDVYRTIEVAPGEATITQSVVKAGHTLVIEDAFNSDYAAKHIVEKFPSRSMLAIPIRSGDKMLGAAMISFNQPHSFVPLEIEYCEQAVRQISLAIANLQNLEAAKKSEQDYREIAAALKERGEHLDEAQTNAKIGSWEQDPVKGKTIWSSGMFPLFNLPKRGRPPSRAELLEQISPDDQDYMSSILGKASEAESISPLEFKTIHGKRLFGEIFREPKTNRLSGTVQDVTAQRLLEAELFQARKMETVGTLAGGIAHNFNNILTVIMGNYDLLKNSIPANTPERKVLDQCLEATDRAALMTRQLLVVSGKHELNPEHINCNHLIRGMIVLLDPLLGDHIEASTDLQGDLPLVHADRGHLEQVLMNLALNSRDAIEAGGEFKISTRLAGADHKLVAISIEDNGPGISEEDLPNIFDPFYTTKEVGKGTGLGLATVQSIVEQSHGEIQVESEPGGGTKFVVTLPAVAVETEQNPQPELVPVESPPQAVATKDRTTILLVEDHESLRNVATFVLERAGYDVIARRHGPDALAVLDKADSLPQLLVTDVQLPGGMNGPSIAKAVYEKTERHIPTIYMSGFRDALPIDDDLNFLAKPFRPHELLEIVSRVLAS